MAGGHGAGYGATGAGYGATGAGYGSSGPTMGEKIMQHVPGTDEHAVTHGGHHQGHTGAEVMSHIPGVYLALLVDLLMLQ